MPDPFSSVFIIVMQANETAVPGVQELCSKVTSAIQGGWSCVNVLNAVDQFNLLVKVCRG